ncbi:MAG: carboxypeptidase-like regulatory domain-containing protein, partial [Desulfovibrionaceae bacterium]
MPRALPWLAAALMAAAGLQFLFAGAAQAHGLSWRSLDVSPALGFVAAFSSGEPASYAEVVIASPESGEVEFQSGRTDARGRFVFLPDAPGSWRVRLDAGMGHALDFELQADEAAPAPSGDPTQPAATPLLAVLGASLALNVFFLLGRLLK